MGLFDKKKPGDKLPGLTPGRQTRSTLDEIEEEMEPTGLFSIFSLRYAAWRDGKMAEALKSRQKARQQVISAHTETVKSRDGLTQAEHNSRKQEVLHTVETAQMAYFQDAAIREYDPQLAAKALPTHVQIPGSIPPPPPDLPEPLRGSPMQVPISPEVIEREALILFARIASQELNEADMEEEIEQVARRYGNPKLTEALLKRLDEMMQTVVSDSRMPGQSIPVDFKEESS